VSAFQAAHYRLTARMGELEQQFEIKASELRAAFVAEIAEIGRGAAIRACGRCATPLSMSAGGTDR